MLLKRIFDARPDTVDFRDLMYVPTLIEVPVRKPLEEYMARKLPVLDQGEEGACTGFGLAAVVNYLLATRKLVPDADPVSPRMLYHMARRYDEWPGENYSGSSARGAMKGWHKHGVCAQTAWPHAGGGDTLTAARLADALKRPLGAYFRVNHTSLVAMHAALSEVGILFATARVHRGWKRVGRDGCVPFDSTPTGGHAFAVVGYDQGGFWIQNSWGADWGHHGFGHLGYEDWLANGSDVWVARLAAPVALPARTAVGAGRAQLNAQSDLAMQHDVWPHVVSIGNNGRLRPDGPFGATPASVDALVAHLYDATRRWKKRRVLLYAHGGLVGERDAVQRIAEYRQPLLDQQVYPIGFSWKSDLWSTIRNLLSDAQRSRRPEGVLDDAKDFMLDRIDDGLEPIARALGGDRIWGEMKANALAATTAADGGARCLIDALLRQREAGSLEIHLVGHSAGSILLAPLAQWLAAARGAIIRGGPMTGRKGLGRAIATCTLWAPACTLDLFKQAYLPAFKAGAIKHLALFTLTDAVEQADHCAHVYHKSLLYLVAHALDDRPRAPFLRPNGVPLLGLARDVNDDREVRAALRDRRAAWVMAPNDAPAGSPSASRALHHGDFDDDPVTVQATLARVLGLGVRTARNLAARTTPIAFQSSKPALRDRRQALG